MLTGIFRAIVRVFVFDYKCRNWEFTDTASNYTSVPFSKMGRFQFPLQDGDNQFQKCTQNKFIYNCPICQLEDHTLQYSCGFKQTFVFFMHHKHRTIFSLNILPSYSCMKTNITVTIHSSKQSTFNPRSTSGNKDVNVFLIRNNACEIHWYQKYELYEFHVN